MTRMITIDATYTKARLDKDDEKFDVVMCDNDPSGLKYAKNVPGTRIAARLNYLTGITRLNTSCLSILSILK